MGTKNQIHLGDYSSAAISILKTLQEQENRERAFRDKAYHKSARRHLGIPVPTCTAITQRLTTGLTEQELLRTSEKLWETDIFDAMICAGKILALSRVPPSNTLWKQLKRYLQDVDGWGLEDLLAHAAWKCVLNDEARLDDIELWTSDDIFWMRRAALVYTLPYAKPGRDPERMLTWASRYANDPEWFIQKAIGWWLRVLSTHNPQRVLRFIQEHEGCLKSVAKHEATRKL